MRRSWRTYSASMHGLLRMDTIGFERPIQPKLEPKPEEKKRETAWSLLREIRDLLRQLVSKK
jgi:hypothetical protein